jgi:2'-5' RNA ligase
MAKLTRQMEAADMKNKSLTQLASQIITLRSEANGQQGGVISAPALPFFPDDHLLGEYAEPTYPQPLTYKSGGHTSAMIALFLPQSVGREFSQDDPQALPLNELHLTIAYLGKAENLSHQQKKNAHYLTRMIAGIYPAMKGAINGCGRFCNGDDDGDPFFIVPDLPLLPDLRHDIINSLKVEDINHTSDHGYTPHITLTYLSHAKCNPFDALEKTPVIFPAISLVLGDDRYDYPFASADNSPLCKAALIEKIGARHTGAECDVIQKMHDLALELGAECHPLTRRAGARHSHADQGLVQRIHDDCAGLGATCKALPEKDRVYGGQVLKETVTKAQSDAPNYAPASNPQRCANCRFFLGDPGRDWCELFDFTADQDYHCDDWEAQRPNEIPGYVASKGNLAALTEGILILRGGATSGNMVLKDWENSTPNQRKARDAINNAIKAGKLEKASTKMCYRCRKRRGAEYHHVNGYSEDRKLKVRPICNICHAALTNRAEMTLRGGATSGNWGHAGRKGKRGGSGKGGGFGRIGVKPGASRKDVKQAAKKKQTKQAPSAKKPKAKPKPKVQAEKPAAKKPAAKSKEQDFNQKDAKKFGWLSEEMASFEKDNAGSKIESGAVYSKDGKELFRVKGDENAVDFNESQLRQMKGAVVTHNHPVVSGHPDGGSFSPSDISLMFNTGAAEVRAVTENYIHVVSPKMVGGRPIKTALGLLDSRKKKIQAKLTKDFHSGKLKRSDFAVEFWHQVWKTAADDGLLNYERIER